MNSRNRTIASLFTVAMAALLLGAVVTTQVHNPEAALARNTEPEAIAPAADQGQVRGTGAAFGLDTFRDIARKVTPGVVNIATKTVPKRDRRRSQPLREFFGDDFDRFFGPDRGQQSVGSGFVVDRDGYLLTNRHVVDGVDQITVTFSNRKAYEAKVIGQDARTDVAVIKIEPREPLTVLEMGDSSQAEVGEWVMAIGQPFGLGSSVTVGVVSFQGRNIGLGVRNTGVDMIQTDAAINPGNSGGPLLNTRGQVIGINTLIFTQGTAQSAGVGFAVPINIARDILPQLRATGKVVRGWLGVMVGPLDEDLAKSYKLADVRGAVVSDVTKDSPAEKAGLKLEDVVLSVDGRAIDDSQDLSSYIASKPPGTTVSLEVYRDGRARKMNVTLGTFPEEDTAEEPEQEERAELGLSLQNLTPDLAERLELPRGASGVVVREVEPGSPADNARPVPVQRGDVIVNVNGSDVRDTGDFTSAIAAARRDSGVARLRVRRGRQNVILSIRLP